VVLDRYGHLLPNHDDELMRSLEDMRGPTIPRRAAASGSTL
jgi:hypothetical protein